jgi:hypothetical protein
MNDAQYAVCSQCYDSIYEKSPYAASAWIFACELILFQDSEQMERYLLKIKPHILRLLELNQFLVSTDTSTGFRVKLKYIEKEGKIYFCKGHRDQA